MAVAAFFIVFLVIAGAIIYASVVQSREADRAWATAAERLALRFQPRQFMSPRKMSGIIKGYGVTVDTFTRSSGKSSTTYTRFVVTYPSIGLGLRLTRQGFFSGISKFFGSQDIVVDDAAFDKDVVVKGAVPEKVVAYLTPALRMKIRGFFQSHPETTIEDARIHWESQGLIGEADRICRMVRAFVDVAAHLTKDKSSHPSFEKAMKARDAGKPEASFRILEEIPPPPPPAPLAEPSTVDVDHERMKGELQYLAGKKQEAQATFEQLARATPQDAEVRQWADYTAEPQPPPPTPAGESGDLDLPSALGALFDPKNSSFDTTRLFETRYQGKTVAWKGRLQSVEPNTFDFVFGGAGGTRATVEVGETASLIYGTTKINAILHIAEDVVEKMNSSVGTDVAFTGRLHKIDGMMSNLFIEDGKIGG